MSQSTKLSLWQKIKRLLTASAPQTIADGAHLPPHLTTVDNDTMPAENQSVDTSDSHTEIGTDTEVDTKNNNEHSQANANPHTEQKERHDTPIIDCLKRYFNNKQWHYNYYQPKAYDRQQSHYLSLRVRHEQLDCGYLFRVQEENKLLAVYGILPFLIPESYQSAAMRLISQINHDMLVGHLEMDNSDGEIRYKNAINVETAGIDEHTIEQLLQSVIAMITVINKLFSNLIDNQNPAEELQDLLMELKQQIDS
ncbi:YbjN domain-containing protein [Psychrobacter sp. AOP22-C1-22]|uniref:YbjN domain-containing protein n=1 Tax=unclassified Psychrobacter TaxID=196806 RepID=UPI0017879170|nr:MULTISPECIES: YbjN domain-containing protein [unclassified Psychrobacter]MBE0406899.1 YbjN domain-containing protein [Psychrobacter sp. FME6]MBE0444990.1 YbjN domain-containing protein [Psychrobacter sp. FME5]MDN5801708.1 YbjN domain-containing protein [Psychrobacter sp.]MDN5890603.1 YbjN domain-containing protein [Psychrobacter sp.]